MDLTKGGDHNQDIGSIELHQFFAELQLQYVHQTFNGLEWKELDHTHIRGTKYIDSIVATPRIRKNLEGSRLFETNEIMNADNLSYVIDINLEDFFKKSLVDWTQ